MQQRIFKLMAVVLVAIILCASSGTVMSYAVEAYKSATELERQGTSTNNENVEFDVCYADGTHTQTLSMTGTEEKIHIKINVKNAGYLENAKIDLSDCNFEIMNSSRENAKIQSIDTQNKIVTLNTIIAGESVDIELNIMPKNDNIVKPEIFNKDNVIKMSGTYINEKAKEVNIKKELIINTKWHGEEESTIEQQLVKCISFDANGKTGLLVQTEITTGVKSSVLPIKSTNIEATIPAIDGIKPEKVLVYSTTTEATNGDKTGVGFTDSNYSYNSENGIITINTVNAENDNGEISWSKNSQDKYEIVLIYSENVLQTIKNESVDLELIANVKNDYYNDTTVASTAEVKSNVTLKDKTGNILDSEIIIEEDSVGKGYLYNNKVTDESNQLETVYNEQYRIGTSYADIVDEIVVKQQADSFIDKNETELSTTVSGVNYAYNKTIKVNKAEFDKILGNDGYIEIIDGDTTIAKIDKTSKANTEGKIELNIETFNTNAIEIKTSKPQTEGLITIEIEKAINKQIGYSQNQIKNFKALSSNAEVNVLTIEKEIETVNVQETMALTEPEEKSSININKKNLSTVVDNEVEMSALLETNSFDDSLYTNPELSIKLPSGVSNINIKSVQLLHSDELSIASYKVVEQAGLKTILVDISGTQTKYNDDVTNGVNVVIYADIALNKNTPSGEDVIIMAVNSKEVSAEVNIVAPYGIVAVNEISGYAENSETITVVDDETATVKLDAYSQSRVAKIKGNIINNYNNSISDVSILGRIPTQESEKYDDSDKIGNTFNTTLAGEISVTNLDEGTYTVYYSTKANANKDLKDSNNNWVTQIQDYSTVNSYLIVLNDSIEKSGEMTFEYSLNIPENLPYNRTINSDYKVYYTNNSEEGNVSETKISPSIQATTGVGPEMNIETSILDVDEGGTVYRGSLITYKVTVKNTGTIDITNVKLSIPVPEGMEFAKATEILNYNSETGNVESILEKISVDEEKSVDCIFKTKTVGKKELIAMISADEFTKAISSNTYTINVEEAEIGLRNFNASGDVVVKDMEACFVLNIENLTDNNLKNLKIQYNLPETIEYKKYNIDTDLDEDITYKDNIVSIDIPMLSAKTEVYINIYGTINEITNNMYSFAKATVNGKEYTSNVVYLSAIKAQYEVVGMNPGEKYIKEGSELETEFSIKNTSDATIYDAILEYNIPDGTTFISASLSNNGEENDIELNSEGKIEKRISILESGNTAKLIVVLKANILESKEDKDVSSYLTVSGVGIDTIESNKVEYVIEYDKQQHNNNNEVNNEDGKNNETSEPGEIEEDEGYKITGKAWLDANENGKYDEGEEALSNIEVLLLNKDSGEIVKDKDNQKEKTTKTDDKGKYTFENLNNGNYLVAFLYDSNIYSITEYQKEGIDKSLNSDAINVDIQYEGQTRKAGLTNTLVLQNANIRDIDIGLYLSPTFDLSLNKYINRVTVNNKQGVSTYEYVNQNKTLAKVDIPAKYIDESTVIIEYKIVVKNEGTVPGYAKKIVDYIPNDLKFNSELNPQAYLGKDGNIYSEELAQTIINPGESKEITLILTKQMTEDNTGTTSNKAEIAEAYNASGIEDTNSEPANKDEKENDLGIANTIITVKTGQVIGYTTLTLTVIAILAVGIYEIKKYVVKTKEN